MLWKSVTKISRRQPRVERWQPDHMNYAWFDNFFKLHEGHGHLHLIPRYASSRTFAERTFTDDRWKQNYVPYTQDAVPIETALAVRDAFIAKLS